MVFASSDLDSVFETDISGFSQFKFDWLYTIFLIWFSSGLYIDTWAHTTYGLELEGFFTPWHAVLYTGFGMTAGILVYYTLKHKAMGLSWRKAVPSGYFASLIGLIIFNIGGFGDGFWHELIGIEVNIDGFYSPPHMALLTGAVLMWLGPFRSAWQRQKLGTMTLQWLPAALSLGLVISLISYFFQYAFIPVTLTGTGLEGIRPNNPVGNNLEGLASTGVIISSVLISAMVLLTHKRWNRPPFGFYTVVMLVFVFGLSMVNATYLNLPLAVVVGLIYDSGLPLLDEKVDDHRFYRIVGFIAPFLFYLVILISWLVTYTIWFNTTMITGLIYLAGMIGLLTSYLIVSPDIPVSD